MKKTLSVLIILLGLALVVTGCQPAVTSIATTTNATETTSTETELELFPVTVQNANGENILIDSAPQSIIVTNVWAAEILLDMIETDRIAGLSAWGDSEAVSAAAPKAAMVESRVTTGDPESIIALNPDLVIIDTFSDIDGSLTKTLTDAGAKVLAMNSPTNFDQIKSAILTLAAAVGEIETGEAMVEAIDEKLSMVADKTADLSDDEKKSVIFYDAALDMNGNDTGLLCAYGAGSPFDAIAAAAGLVNVCDAVTYSQISKEKVVAEWQPDILIVSSLIYNPDFTISDDQGENMIGSILTNDLLQTLPAIQNNQVFALTGKYASSTSHYMAQAVVELAQKAYPELFE